VKSINHLTSALRCDGSTDITAASPEILDVASEMGSMKKRTYGHVLMMFGLGLLPFWYSWGPLGFVAGFVLTTLGLILVR
jgi:hypothetical protein